MPSYVTKEELAAAKKALNERIDKLATRVSAVETAQGDLGQRVAALETAEEPEPDPESPTADAILWGARIDGEVYGAGDAPWTASTWDTFERHAGKKVSVLHWGQPFGALDMGALGAVFSRDAVSLISVGLPLETTLADIAAGRQDAVIDAFAGKCKQFGGEILLRPWWEMNGGWFSWGRKSEFVAAWRRLYSRVKAIAPNVSFVWCPNAIWDAASDPQPWFPGNEYVDWTGIDAYNRGTSPVKGERWKTPMEVFKPTYDRVLQLAPGKPILICETASTEYGGSKAEWITDLLGSTLPSLPAVRGLVWFNWNVLENGGHMDWPIESSPESQAAFAKGIASSYYRAPLST